MTVVSTADRVVVSVTATDSGDWQVVSVPTGFQGIVSTLFSENDFLHGFVRHEDGEQWEVYDFEGGDNANLLQVTSISGTVTLARPATPFDSSKSDGTRMDAGSGTHTLALSIGSGTLKQIFRETSPFWKTFTSADATPSVAGYRLFKTNGSTQITRFDDLTSGQRFVVRRGSADINIAHNGTDIDLYGGKDLTLTVQSPAVEFVVDGTTARQISGGVGFGAVTMTSGDATPTVAIADWLTTAGSTDITDFDDAFEAQVIVIQRGAADITLKHDVTKIDLSGADLTLTAAAPRATLRSVGGVWKLVAVGENSPYRRQRHIIRNYLTDISGVTEGSGGVAGTNGSAIQAAINSGGAWYLRPGERINSSQLILPSNTAILYEGPWTNRPFFYMPAATFTNSVLALPSDYATGCLLKIQGLTTGPYTPVDDVHLEGFMIQSEVADGRALNGISARNVTNLIANGIEIFGLPMGTAFNMDSVVDFDVDDIYVHECTTNLSSWVAGSYCNVTGIGIDNGRINSIGSKRGRMRNLKFKDIYVGSTFLGTYPSGLGHQTDGITFNYGCSDISVSGLKAYNCGEAADIQGERIMLDDVYAENCPAYGVKFIHGARHCVVKNGVVKDVGINHIVLAGSNSSGVGDTTGNIVEGFVCAGFIASGSNYYATLTQANIGLSGSSGFTYKATKNAVRNTVVDGTGGEYVVRDDENCDYNIFDLHVLAPGSSGYAPQMWSTTNKVRPTHKTYIQTLLTANASVSAASFLQLKFDTTTGDQYSQYSSSTGRFTAAYPMVVNIKVRARWVSFTAGQTASLRVFKNGAEIGSVVEAYGSAGSGVTPTSVSPAMTEEFTVSLNTGDYITVFVQNGDASNARSITGSSDVITYMTVTEI